MAKVRADVLLVQRGLAETREKAQALVMAGQVFIGEAEVTKQGMFVREDAKVVVREPLRYVSRGGLKLEKALDEFGLDVGGRVLADVGASTGGFTDCLLQRGAKRVYAIDVGYGQLHWKLRQAPRVVIVEKTNIRHLEGLPEPVDGATVDVSFISLTLVLPKVAELVSPEGWIVALVKPQFEAGKEQVRRGGVVKDAAVHRQVLEKVLGWAIGNGLHVAGATESPLVGPAGNKEFLVYLRKQGPGIVPNDAINGVFAGAGAEKTGKGDDSG